MIAHYYSQSVLTVLLITSFPFITCAQTGAITGEIKVDGEIKLFPPLIKAGEAVRDAAICGARDIPDESILVDRDNRGLANVFVFLRKGVEGVRRAAEGAGESAVTIDDFGLPLRTA